MIDWNDFSLLVSHCLLITLDHCTDHLSWLCRSRNANGLTAADLARAQGFQDCAQLLSNAENQLKHLNGFGHNGTDLTHIQGRSLLNGVTNRKRLHDCSESNHLKKARIDCKCYSIVQFKSFLQGFKTSATVCVFGKYLICSSFRLGFSCEACPCHGGRYWKYACRICPRQPIRCDWTFSSFAYWQWASCGQFCNGQSFSRLTHSGACSLALYEFLCLPVIC